MKFLPSLKSGDSFGFVKPYKTLIFTAAVLFLSCKGGQPDVGSFKDDLGRSVRELTAGGSIVSLAANTTELVCWMGGMQRLKGVTRYCTLPEGSPIARVGSMLTPNLERIALLKPSLVLLSFEGNTPKLASSLARLSIPVYVIRIESVQELFKSLERLAAVLKISCQHKIVRLKKSIRQLKGKLSGKRLFFHIPGGRTVFTYGSQTLLGDLLRIAGAHNTGASFSGRFPKVSPERLAALRVETAVILGDKKSSTSSSVRKFWKRVSPRTKLVFTEEAAFFRPGPAMVHALNRLAGRL